MRASEERPVVPNSEDGRSARKKRARRTATKARYNRARPAAQAYRAPAAAKRCAVKQAPARVVASASRYFGLSRKLMSVDPRAIKRRNIADAPVEWRLRPRLGAGEPDDLLDRQLAVGWEEMRHSTCADGLKLCPCDFAKFA